LLGSANSSNFNRLREVAKRMGITAGASAPELQVQQVIHRFKELGAISVRTMECLHENVSFPLPVGWAHGDRYSRAQWEGPEGYC
jgi:hypothetical protein